MTRRRRKYKRRSAPGWYNSQRSKKNAVRLTVLSLLAMLLLVIAVPVIFWAGGGFNAMAGDTKEWTGVTAEDFDSGSLSYWGSSTNMSRVRQTQTEALGIDGPVSWYYPDEQNETYSTIVMVCGSAECSATDGGVFGYVFHLGVKATWMLDNAIAYMRVQVRMSIGGSFHLEDLTHEDVGCGAWVDSDSNGIEPGFFGSKRNVDQKLVADNWTTVDYSFSRTKVLQAIDGLGTGSNERMAMGLNLTNGSVAPKDFDSEVLDFRFMFFSAGGGVKVAGEVYGWSMGLVLMIGAAASTPYWNPTREKGQRKWRRSRRWYR